MKAIFCLSIGIFAILRIFTLAPHNTYKQACSFEFGLGKSIRDSFVVCLKKRAELTSDNNRGKENLYDSSKFFSRKNFDIYVNEAASLSKKFNCKKIDYYSVVEVFLTENVYEEVWFYYFIIHMKSGFNKIYFIDARRNEEKYLGSLKRDYFTDMATYILGNELKDPLLSGYLMYFSFTNKKVLSPVNIGTGVFNTAQYQPLFLLEEALFKKQ